MILALEHRYDTSPQLKKPADRCFNPCLAVPSNVSATFRRPTYRYYSEVSNPTPVLNRTTRELLSVKQALEDAAHYIETLKNEV